MQDIALLIAILWNELMYKVSDFFYFIWGIISWSRLKQIKAESLKIVQSKQYCFYNNANPPPPS